MKLIKWIRFVLLAIRVLWMNKRQFREFKRLHDASQRYLKALHVYEIRITADIRRVHAELNRLENDHAAGLRRLQVMKDGQAALKEKAKGAEALVRWSEKATAYEGLADYIAELIPRPPVAEMN